MQLKNALLFPQLGRLTRYAALIGLTSAPVIGMELIWSDEFEVDGLPNPEKWMYDVGGHGWGNNEEQYYTESRLENARVEGGVLIIEARKDGWPLNSRTKTNAYTSARLVSKGRGDILYGRIEARAKLPSGRGTWPAIWMLPTGWAYGGWPRSGEIDIMEHVGFDMGKIHGSLHTLNYNWSSGGNPTGYTMVPDAHTTFHTYSVDWTPEGISFAVDGQTYFSADRISRNWEDWPFDQPFHVLLNIAVGGFWGGLEGIDPDIWPQRMEIDYVRFYDLGQTVPLDTDEDGQANAVDNDDDGDGLDDLDEHRIGTNLLVEDTDGDGFLDGDEVEAATNPLLTSSYPGADPSLLFVNPQFESGSDPWTVHTNKLNAEGQWQSQEGSWGGAYAVFDWVSLESGEGVLFRQFDENDAPQAEHLLYQEWNSAVAEMKSGDVIRFRGSASLSATDAATYGEAFIRILDFAYLPMEYSATVELGSGTAAFALEAVIPEEAFNVMQIGFLIKGPQTDPATITFSDIVATINETPDSQTWAGWQMTYSEDNQPLVNTGAWLGWIALMDPSWQWSYGFNGWVYLPESLASSTGGWLYRPTN